MDEIVRQVKIKGRRMAKKEINAFSRAMFQHGYLNFENPMPFYIQGTQTIQAGSE